MVTTLAAVILRTLDQKGCLDRDGDAFNTQRARDISSEVFFRCRRFCFPAEETELFVEMMNPMAHEDAYVCLLRLQGWSCLRTKQRRLWRPQIRIYKLGSSKSQMQTRDIHVVDGR